MITAVVLREEKEEGLLTLTLSRPPVNAMSMGLAISLTDALERAEGDPEVTVVVLRGQGRGFCAGADLHEAREMNREQSLLRHRVTGRLFRALYECKAPVVCAMHGFAIGAGLGLACMTDLRIASSGTVVGMPEVRWMLSVGGGGSKLRRLGLGEGQLRELMLTGELVPVGHPLARGLVDHVVGLGEFDDAIAELVGRLLARERTALRAVKAAMNVAERHADWAAAYEATHDISADLVESADVKAMIDQSWFPNR